MSSFFKILTAVSEVGKVKSSVDHFVESNMKLLKKIMSGKEVSATEFLNLCDSRTYDIHSKQNDIKVTKELDFRGVYAIINRTKEKYYLGQSGSVFRKVERHFKGYEHPDIFSDFKRKNKFVIQFFKLENSKYTDLNEFEKVIRSQLSEDLEPDQFY